MFHRPVLLIGALIIFLLIFVAAGTGVLSAPVEQSDSSSPTPTPDPRLSVSNQECLTCHGQPGPSLKLENGEVLDLYVSPQDYAASIHGSEGYACVQCHREVGRYPHPPLQSKSLREVSLQLYPACRNCHEHQYELAQDSVHATALSEGKSQAAICTDCHTAHYVRRLNKPGTLEMLPDARVWVPVTCSRCHNAIYSKYKDSVHGSALIGEGNPDVPTCIDCHGVHNIENPTTAAFRLRSPEICAKCHTDEERMAKYGISTQVLNTYVADFHGTTVMLFEKITPDAQTNKPVCYDCHGIHDISRVDDPQKGLEVRQNLLARCQKCHPDASSNFPSAWLSHYIPSPDKNPIVYYVNLFYKFLIPTVLGGMALLVALDLNKLIGSRLRRPVKKASRQETAVEEAPLLSDQPGDDTEIIAEPERSSVAPEDRIELLEEQPKPEPASEQASESENEAQAQTPPETGVDPDEESSRD